MYSILVVGAGYVGSEIARHFAAKKQKVFALVRTERSAANLQGENITAVIADITQPLPPKTIPPAHFVVLCPAPQNHEEKDYRAIYLDGIRNVIEAMKKNPRPFLLLYLSSTSVWKERAGEWIDETVLPDADSEKGKIMREAEELVLNSGFPSMIFRLAGIYGPGRNRVRAAKAGSWKAEGPDAYVNMIHRDDIVNAIPVLFKKGKEGEVYLGVDDTPVLRSEFQEWVHAKLNLPKPLAPENAPVGGKRCRNAKLKDLDFQFAYPSFREGYGTLL